MFGRMNEKRYCRGRTRRLWHVSLCGLKLNARNRGGPTELGACTFIYCRDVIYREDRSPVKNHFAARVLAAMKLLATFLTQIKARAFRSDRERTLPEFNRSCPSTATTAPSAGSNADTTR
jgi:hypothetical protein